MNQFACIFIGGGVGACLRYVVYRTIQSRVHSMFPWGTWVVNVSGAFMMGLLVTIFVDHFELNPEWRYFLIVGVLGGYTTFSALSWEAYELFSVGASLQGTLYLLGSALGGTMAVLGGVWIGRKV